MQRCNHGTPIGRACSKCTQKKRSVSEVCLNDEVMAQAFMRECTKKFERKAKENNRSLEPWKDYSTAFILERLFGEVRELIDAADGGDPKAIMDECLDVAIFAWFQYEQARIKAEGP